VLIMGNKKDKFIEMFNELYEHLKEVNDWDTSFYSLLHEGRNNDYIIKKYIDELDTVREVRNSIAHNNEYYFLPSSSLYTLLEEILDKVIDSPKISDFIDDNLMVIKEDTSIIKAGNKIDAFLITKNGSREEVLQGIITDWEIPEIYNKLNI